MGKRKDTCEIENSLIEMVKDKRIYGCEEVTVGFPHTDYAGNGLEIVDFLTVDSNEEICCYEIKVTLQDLKSSAKKSWYGNYNYLAVSDELWELREKWIGMVPEYVGIKVGRGLCSVTNAVRQEISEELKEILVLSLARTLTFKMYKYRDMADLEKQAEQRKQLNYFERECKKSDRIIEYYENLERYFRYYMKKVRGLEEMDIKKYLMSKQQEFRNATGRNMKLPEDPREWKGV